MSIIDHELFGSFSFGDVLYCSEKLYWFSIFKGHYTFRPDIFCYTIFYITVFTFIVAAIFRLHIGFHDLVYVVRMYVLHELLEAGTFRYVEYPVQLRRIPGLPCDEVLVEAADMRQALCFQQIALMCCKLLPHH